MQIPRKDVHPDQGRGEDVHQAGLIDLLFSERPTMLNGQGNPDFVVPYSEQS